MTFLIAAAGTGGHVFPGLAVGEALLERGVPRQEVLYVGGDRLETKVYPDHGFPFLQLEVRGLKRSAALSNAGIPKMLARAKSKVVDSIESRQVKAALGMGGYVTIPVGMAARKTRIPFFTSEQNAVAGLASRIAARWTRTSFSSFPTTVGLPDAEWVGNPVRQQFWNFDRTALRSQALARYGLSDALPTLGVFGGSLGSGVINQAVAEMALNWDSAPVQILHLAGERFADTSANSAAAPGVTWVRLGFETEMEYFYAASDLVVARAGGAVAELTATATPSILIPGAFGSGGHQEGNAKALTAIGAAEVVTEDALETLPAKVGALLHDSGQLSAMASAASTIARPDAARVIADILIEAAAQ